MMDFYNLIDYLQYKKDFLELPDSHINDIYVFNVATDRTLIGRIGSAIYTKFQVNSLWLMITLADTTRTSTGPLMYMIYFP